MPGYRFCIACKCEIKGCDKGRDKSHAPSGRWCWSHRHLLSGRGMYANEHGQHAYGQSWPTELRLTARLAFLFQQMRPLDLVAFMRFARQLWQFRQRKFTKDDLIWLICASALKWPLAVYAFWDVVFPRLSLKPDAETVRSCVTSAIRACDAQTLSDMHAEISVTGRAAVVSGPKWLGGKLGILQAESALRLTASEQVHVRLTKKTQQQPQTVQLGKKRKTFLLAGAAGAVTACQHLIDCIQCSNIEWPDSNEPTTVATFADALVDCVHQGLNIARDKGKNAYSAVGVARKVLMFASELMPDIFDKCGMKNILMWTADEGAHVDVLKPMRGGAVREAFGLQPVMISCWTCYLACCTDMALRALQEASDQHLSDMLAELKKQGNASPGPHTLARVLIGRSALRNGPE